MKLFFSLQSTEAVVQRCSVKKVFLEISLNSQENTCARVSFLKELQAKIFRKINISYPLIRTRTTLAQVFSCEVSGISKNIFFHKTPLVAASGSILVHKSTQFYISYACVAEM